MPHVKFQDSSISGSRVSQLPSIMDRQTDGQTNRRTDGQAQTNMLPQILRSCGHKNQSSMTSIKYAHLQVMATISGKFHKNPLKTVGGVAETSTSVDKMAKSVIGP